MTSQWRLGPRDDAGLVASGDHRYATWDAAYVLGSLTASDRRAFEAHMAGCPACQDAVATLSGMPALLSELSPEDMAVISASDPAENAPGVSSDLLPSLLATVRWRRRRGRLIAWSTGAAAAVVLSIGVLVGVTGVSPSSAPQTTVSALPMTQVSTTALTSTVSVSGQRWGTLIDLNCVCLAPANAPHDTLAMVVVGRDGSRTRLATWVAEPRHTATPAASIAMPVNHISAVQVVAAGNDQVLLEHKL